MMGLGSDLQKTRNTGNSSTPGAFLAPRIPYGVAFMVWGLGCRAGSVVHGLRFIGLLVIV